MSDPVFLELEAILALYDDIASTLGVGVNSFDAGRLSSAVSHPQQHYFYSERHVGVQELAARLAYAIAKFHPFGDGNKRTALSAMELALASNGYTLTASDHRVARMIEFVAGSVVSEDAFIVWVCRNSEPIER